MSPYSLRITRLAPLCALLALPAAAQELSEKDYFGDLPVVLSVSRLAQPLDEVPGAVTIIDAETIRRSGARSVQEVLRLVPGFLFTRRNGANPVASYHAALDLYGGRMQVYIDGRSVYSSFYIGDTHRGLDGLVLEDIDRIEVLRGSNSASYGADAFLGVVNIITRNTADTRGVMMSVSMGDKGINDNVARIGWGDQTASFRLTGSRRADRGMDDVYDDTRLSQLHFRADLNPGPRDEVRIHAGTMEGGFGEGLPGSAGNIERTVRWNDIYLHANWRRELADNETLESHFSYEQDRYADRFPYANPFFNPPVTVNFGGTGTRMETGFQHTFVPLTGTRLVWGAEWRRETAYSPSLFYSNEVFSINRARTFANLEWRPHPQWLINAGGLYENHNIVGHSFAPRVMANFHIVPDHTLRVGVTESSRAPGLYELRGDTRYFSGNAMADWAFHSSGTVKAERVSSNEVGYFGRFRSLGLSVDIRAFVERMRDRVVFYGRTGTGVPNNAINTPGPDIHGVEYQFDWRPFATTRVVFSEAQLRVEPGSSNSERSEAPYRTGNLALYQKLPGGFDLSLIHYSATPYAWAGSANILDATRQLDARLAYAFRVGATRGELAVTVQSIGGSHMEYLPSQFFGRRAFTSLRLDF